MFKLLLELIQFRSGKKTIPGNLQESLSVEIPQNENMESFQDFFQLQEDSPIQPLAETFLTDQRLHTVLYILANINGLKYN